jgi:hypothetical protein
MQNDFTFSLNHGLVAGSPPFVFLRVTFLAFSALGKLLAYCLLQDDDDDDDDFAAADDDDDDDFAPAPDDDDGTAEPGAKRQKAE